MIRADRSISNPRPRWLAGLALLFAFLLSPATSLAYSFKPTPAEWAQWPEYCRARYVVSTIGKTSPYSSMVPPATVQMWRSRLGEATFDPLHHHCAGMIHMQRARMADSEQRRKFEYRSAERNIRYTLERIPPTSPLYREVFGNYQMAKAALGSL